MLKNIKKAMLAAAFLGIGVGSAWAADTDLQTGNVTLTGTETNIINDGNSSTVTNLNGATTDIFLAPATGNTWNLGLSEDGTRSDNKVNVNLRGLAVTGRTIELYSSANGLGSSLTVTGTGTGINQEGFRVGLGGTLNIHDSSSADVPDRNEVNITNLFYADGVNTNDMNVNIGRNSLFNVDNTSVVLGNTGAGGTAFNINGTGIRDNDGKGGGIVEMNNVTLAKGTISGNIDWYGTTLNLSTGTGNIYVGPGITQNYNDTVVTNTLGKIQVNSNGKPATMNVTTLNVKGGLTEVTAQANTPAYMNVNGILTVTQTDNYTKGNIGFGVVGTNSTGTGTINVKQLEMNSAVAEKAKLYVGAFGNLNIDDANSTTTASTLNHGSITVAKDGNAVFKDVINLINTSDVTLDGGTGAFYQNWTGDYNNDNNQVIVKNAGTGNFANIKNFDITRGQLVSTGTGDNQILVNSDGMTLSKTNALKVDISTKIVNTSDPRNPSGDVIVNSARAIDMATAKSVLNAQNMSITNKVVPTGGSTTPADIYSTATAGSLVNLAGDFTLDSGANAQTNKNVTMTVSGQGYIHGTYASAGDEIYEKDLTIDGIYKTNGTDDLNVHIGTSNYKGTVHLNGGDIIALNNTTMNFLSDNSSVEDFIVTGDSSISGNVNAGPVSGTPGSPGFNTIVGTGTNLDFNKANYTTTYYNQTGGNSFLENSNVDTAKYNQTGGDMTLNNKSNLIAGLFNQSAGNLISNDANSWVTATDAATVSGGFFQSNANFNKGATFSNDAVLKSSPNYTTTILGSGLSGDTANVLTMKGNSSIDMSTGSVVTSGFNAVDVKDNAQIIVGIVDSVPTQLTVKDVNGGAKGILNTNLQKSLQLNSELMAYLYDNPDTLDGATLVDAKVNGTQIGDWINQSIYGDYVFNYDGTEYTKLKSYDVTNLDDKDSVRQQLNSMWGTNNFSDGLAGAGAGEALGYFEYVGLNGLANQSIFNAMNTKTPFGFKNSAGKWISGMFDQGLAQALMGSNLAGPVYISRDVTRNLTNNLFARTDAYRKVVECVTANCGTALGSTILNDRYLNRIWVGGLGDFENASDRNGYSGYKYKAGGVQLGYDRAFGAMIAGLSASYIRGNYEDKAASQHDSKITNWAFDLYATYNFTSGFFATVAGGYTYSQNALKELYGKGSYQGKDYPGAWGNEDYHTNTWWASGKIGYDIEVCDNFAISPSIGVNWWDSRASAHDFVYGGENITHYSDIKTHGVEVPLEVRVAYDINFSDKAALTLEANGGYAYNFTDNGVRANVTNNGVAYNNKSGNLGAPSTYDATGRKLGHNSWYAGAGIRFRYDHWDLGVKYDYYGRSSYTDHRINAQVGYSF